MEQAPYHYKCLKDKYFPFSESSKGVPMTFIYSTSYGKMFHITSYGKT